MDIAAMRKTRKISSAFGLLRREGGPIVSLAEMAACGPPGWDAPSRTIVMQRMRNRIMEYLELASSFQAQRDYSRHAGDVPNEVINQWQDLVYGNLASYDLPVFSSEEQAAIRNYQAVWLGVVDDTPDPLPALEPLIETEPWRRLRSAAETALQVFARRGKLDEDRELVS